ncbi:MAG TPA: hypothetical protein PKA90_10585 [Ignavibacteria bacterium]|nr:hypothetical protein [Ignavibacteria bacterium]
MAQYQDNNSEKTQQEHSNQGLRNLFKVDESTGVSKFRFYMLRSFYLIIIIFLGIEVWTEIFTHREAWKPLPAVAYSFWAAFTLLSVIGIFHPLKMIPLLLVQFTYKLIWLLIVAYPLWTSGQLTGSASEELTYVNLTGIVIDLLVIPWFFVFKNFFLPDSRKRR